MKMTVWTPETLLALGTPLPQLATASPPPNTTFGPKSMLTSPNKAVESCQTLQNQPPLFDLASLAHLRANIAFARPPPDPAILETDLDGGVRDGATIKLRWYRPATPAVAGSPLVVHYHGGGFIFGNLNTAAVFCRTIVRDHDAVVVDVDYRLAPEYPFPIGKNDAWDALEWVCRGRYTSRRKDTDADAQIGRQELQRLGGEPFPGVPGHGLLGGR